MSNPSVGMIYPVWAPFVSHVDGQMPVYGTGRVLQEARKATVTKEMNDNPFYGDDHIVDDDNGMTGLTISFESTGLSNEDRVAVLGEEVGEDGIQWETDGTAPWGGFGYIRRMRDNGVRKFEAYWTLKIKFAERSQETSTKESQITWGAPTLEGTATCLQVDDSDHQKWRGHETFDTAAAAKAWLNGLANITQA